MSDDAVEVAFEIIDLFTVDLADDDIDPTCKAVESVIKIALDAAVGALPDTLQVGDLHVPVGPLVDALLRPAIERGIAALIEATRPARVVVNNPETVSGTIS